MGIIKFVNDEGGIINEEHLHASKTTQLARHEELLDFALNDEGEKNNSENEATLLRLGEDVSLREENAKHYRMSDGTYQAEYYCDPVHYFDENKKEFLSIDNTLCDCPACQDDEDDFDGYENKQAQVKVKFSKNANNRRLFVVKKGAHKVVWKLIGKKNKSSKDGFVSDVMAVVPHLATREQSEESIENLCSEIRYNDFAENTDLQYIVSSSCIKENIIVKANQESYKYDFELKLTNLDIELSEDCQTLNLFINKINEETGEIIKDTIFTIPMPYMFDANGAKSTEVSYELARKNNGSYIFSIIADETWINSSERAFPVTIDPALVYYSESNLDFYSLAPLYNDGKCANLPGCNVGYSSQYGPMRLYLKIKNLIKPMIINKAILNMYQGLGKYEPAAEISKKFIVEKIVSTWEPSSLTWSNQPNLSQYPYYVFHADAANENEIGKGTPTKDPLSIDLTKVLNEENNGILIKSMDELKDENGNYYINLASSRVPEAAFKPVLIIFYSKNRNITSNKQHQTSVKRAGTGLLDLFTKNLLFVHNDFALTGNKMPLSISHYYNSKYKNHNFMFSENNEKTSNINFGRGWRSNYHQYMFPAISINPDVESSLAPKYEYIDQYGNITNFIKIVKDGVECLVDENTRKIKYDEANRIITDKHNNKLYFNFYGQLYKIENSFGVKNTICFKSNQSIDFIVDGNNRRAYFYYDEGPITAPKTNGMLTRITYANGQKDIKFSYDSLDRLKDITYQDGTKSEYTYDSANNLIGIRDKSGYKVSYNFLSDKVTIQESTNVSKITNNQVTPCNEKLGNKITVDYYKNRTTLQGIGDKTVVHVFNNIGIANCSYTLDNVNIDGVQAVRINEMEYNSNSNGEYLSASSNKADKNYVINDGFERWWNTWEAGPNIGPNDDFTSSEKLSDISSFRMGGIIEKEKYISQIVTVPNDIDCFILSGFAKGYSMGLNESTKCEISATVNYTDGDREVHPASFNYLDENWRPAAVAFKKKYNKTILNIEVKLEVSYNCGTVYFDIIRLTKGRYSSQKTTDNITVVSDAAGNVVTMTADDSGNIIKSVATTLEGQNFETEYTYSKGKVTTQKDKTRNIQVFNAYDNFGNPTVSRLKNTTDTDPNNEIIQSQQYDANSNNNNVYRIFDERGNLFTQTNVNDTNGLLTSVTYPNGQNVSYSYNTNGDVIGMTSMVDLTGVSNTYNYTRGLLTKITSSNNIYTFEYDGFGVLTKTLLNGKEIIENAYKNDSKYDTPENANYSTTSYLIKDDANKALSRKTVFKSEFNKNGDLSCEKTYETDGNNSKISGTERELLKVNYDELNRVTSILDNGMGVNKQIKYTSILKEDGTLDYIQISGDKTGQLKETYDKRGNIMTKNITFNESKNYSFYYDKIGVSVAPDNRLNSIGLPNGSSSNYEYDKLSRLSGRYTKLPYCTINIKETYEYLKSQEDPYQCLGQRTTNFIKRVNYSAHNFSSTANYTYDANGNIETVLDGGYNISYNYDELNRLTRENNQMLNRTRLYEYDSNGNVQRIKEYNYTTGINLINERITTYTYDSTQKDKLIKITYPSGAQAAINSYDNLGNPCNYKNNVLEWKQGRLLSKYGNNTYLYDANGIRQEKTVNGEKHIYYTEGSRIHKEEYGSTKLWYLYDATGIIGLIHNGENYYFQKNIQGDVIRVFNNTSGLVASYDYDAWGNHKVRNGAGQETTSASFIGNINPFRYRGYYYDKETNLYYLQSRYYDPEIGRFINADDIAYIAPEEFNGLNLYAYCLNNPVNLSDSTGTSWWIDFWKTLGAIALVTIAVAGFAALAVFTGGTSLIAGAALMSVAVGIGVGAGIGAASALINGTNFVGGLLSGAIKGGAIGAAIGLGIMTGGGAFSVGGGFLALGGAAALNFGAGMASYAIDNSSNGRSLNWKDALASGGMQALSGAFAFGAGAILGVAGFYNGPGITKMFSAKWFGNLAAGTFIKGLTYYPFSLTFSYLQKSFFSGGK